MRVGDAARVPLLFLTQGIADNPLRLHMDVIVEHLRHHTRL
ncbi:hypothetical protein SM0020_00170 [Sinorhizobium meliloti CCNWSX0020]|uniref:Uncharacterized protein n=1 Tax=Sinorhizobium meliloti CCNWSX0020 TaxID=1107881 RepID=H0FSA8_RHIML|nr:hypothetical protein SM0020_00170 [Sinorhizobium meliloti CCNWSX0020]PII38044.1 hypothetical protein T190_27100 [Sinorhizobium meliloti CCBAU 01290]